MNNELPTTGNSSVLKKVLLPIVLILAISVGALMLVRSQFEDKGAATQAEAMKVGSIIPDVTLDRFPSGESKLSSLGKKIYFINFWASWCEACISEMPSIVKLYDKYKEKGLEVLAINLDEEPDSVIPKATQELGMNFPIFKDPESVLADMFRVAAIPLTVIVDADRKILHLEDGDRDWMDKEIQAKMNEWLK
jgi:thiol-disulfide isomerase/thioredoxin